MKLKVLKPYAIDRHNVVARIDYDTMKVLDISDKDFIRISGDSKTVAKCLPLNPADNNLDSVSLSQMVMKNSRSKVGDIIDANKIESIIANEINFTSPSNIMPSMYQHFFPNMLEGFPASKGDELIVPHFSDKIFLNIISISPERSGYVSIISQDTIFRYREMKNTTISSSNFYTDESMQKNWNKYFSNNDASKKGQSDNTLGFVDSPEAKSKVFIIHGHDMEPAYELERLLVKKFNLQTIILKDQAGRNRPLIDKFVDEIKDVRFAFAILTPDDIIESKDGKYAQARPNVIYELGYFGGKIGRENTCILIKKNTKIHSDLNGVEWIEFDNSIEDRFLKIEQELEAAGIVKPRTL